eukprot:1159131-Pelagomonas_calceolata.AAC.7
MPGSSISALLAASIGTWRQHACPGAAQCCRAAGRRLPADGRCHRFGHMIPSFVYVHVPASACNQQNDGSEEPQFTPPCVRSCLPLPLSSCFALHIAESSSSRGQCLNTRGHLRFT